MGVVVGVWVVRVGGVAVIVVVVIVGDGFVAGRGGGVRAHGEEDVRVEVAFWCYGVAEEHSLEWICWVQTK
ncbi:hypothetical protein VTK26DRAFT_3855 [Humicola hyalothermophila]